MAAKKTREPGEVTVSKQILKRLKRKKGMFPKERERSTTRLQKTNWMIIWMSWIPEQKQHRGHVLKLSRERQRKRTLEIRRSRLNQVLTQTAPPPGPWKRKMGTAAVALPVTRRSRMTRTT